MSAYLMSSEDLSKLANVMRLVGVDPGEVASSAMYDLLLDENLKSLSYRYPDAGRISDWDDRGEAAYIYDAALAPKNAREALDIVRSYDYQSCEHPTYRESVAGRFAAELRTMLEPLTKAEMAQEAKEREAQRAAVIEALKPVDLYSKETAAMVRKLLKRAFPACKFSVVTERGSMVSSIRIAWTDGPSEKAVMAIAGQFKAGDFDGMTDSYDYDRDHFVQVDGVYYRPCCRYVFAHRAISPTLASKCVAQVTAYWGGVDIVPTVVPGYSGFSLEPSDLMHRAIRKDLEAPHYSWYACIRKAAEDRTAYERST